MPAWYRPPGVKTKFDFPKAKDGKSNRMEFPIGDRHPSKPKRLDKYLTERFQGYSRSFLQKMIKDEKVLINSKITKSSWHVSTGEIVTLILHEGGGRIGEEIPFDIVFQDEHIISVVKPSGIVVHPARGHKSGTLWNGLLHYFRDEIAADPSFHLGTIHRLDEQTSGVMIFAICAKAHSELTRQFESRLAKKTYLCLAHGDANFSEKIITAPLGTDPTDKYRVAVDGLGARPAETRYVKLASSRCGQFSLLRAFPHTGRTHQIRVHAKALGHPLIGDVLYGGVKEHEAFSGITARVCLHAESLAITHPATGQPLVLCAPLPPDFLELIAQLNFAGCENIR
jgi:23S rRNA pseudouridine1911/1915/1917 synthase